MQEYFSQESNLDFDIGAEIKANYFKAGACKSSSKIDFWCLHTMALEVAKEYKIAKSFAKDFLLAKVIVMMVISNFLVGQSLRTSSSINWEKCLFIEETSTPRIISSTRTRMGVLPKWKVKNYSNTLLPITTLLDTLLLFVWTFHGDNLDKNQLMSAIYYSKNVSLT